MPVIRGRCLCGGIQFEIVGPLIGASNCHCSKCQKQQGAAFRSRARVEKSDFNWIQGEQLVSFYQSSPGFSRVCGSPIVNKYSNTGTLAAHNADSTSRYGIALATLDDDPGVRPAAHVFVSSKAPWFTITDDLPQFTGTSKGTR